MLFLKESLLKIKEEIQRYKKPTNVLHYYALFYIKTKFNAQICIITK